MRNINTGTRRWRCNRSYPVAYDQAANTLADHKQRRAESVAKGENQPPTYFMSMNVRLEFIPEGTPTISPGLGPHERARPSESPRQGAA
jgi:hypothetical protein